MFLSYLADLAVFGSLCCGMGAGYAEWVMNGCVHDWESMGPAKYGFLDRRIANVQAFVDGKG